MPKLKIRGDQLTLPADLREMLVLSEDDAIEAEEVEEGILLKRSPAAQRKAALDDIRAAQKGVRYLGPQPRPAPEREEREIADMLAADKAEELAKSSK
jgi:bifunctional DNA-binding transcriptional regulator/antitoxin component of YhaV-PrlF toxin-antitoxin module